MNLVCKIEELKLHECNNKLDWYNKIISKKDYKLRKAIEEKEKLNSELVALSEKVQKLEWAKEEEAKAVEETTNKLKEKIEALQHDLDTARA